MKPTLAILLLATGCLLLAGCQFHHKAIRIFDGDKNTSHQTTP